ncbi:aminomethyl-transferring glycine dehydrogenase subunit GcvPB [Desulfotalea psychrophila]|uniref:glycine dehydrogenase (aminomethyl-transferring) n=1 Tax=Desulfotalea psychrophila (strain LSv54 / DSM 12343) TaxID=177439 RepID=Q6ARJ8_DESPS|nr:aminomethyl-transferring glycine dehydrogenase subunit GcvPB [Desulfotalea psychrophila]CAG35027.1 probable glycine dehydrogenase, subunit 2 [Desulfotalea psychrophila LSv54]
MNASGNTGLILDEPLLWEKGSKGRMAFSMPENDVPAAELDPSLLGAGPDFPDLSEVDVVRHYTRLSQWNFGVDTGMYPLGSCTMKYNPKINERFAAMPEITSAHPMLEAEDCQGLLQLQYDLQEELARITGMDATTLQPAAGAQGEFTGMLAFACFHKSNGEKRSKILIPDTAHGTNPASASLCGFKPVSLKSNDTGVLDAAEVERLMDEDTAGIMLTIPNTLGIFERDIRKIADIVHAKGGLVYGDGANMNASMGMIDYKRCGVDIMHLNLHKTFSTPHGGGGPGAGAVCAVNRLLPFLPRPMVIKDGESYKLDFDRPQSLGRVHAFYGNYGVLVRTHSYIRSMGGNGLRLASQLAVLNANYIKAELRDTFHLGYETETLHECVFSDANQVEYGVTTLDMAKRLIDYGYHPPTIYFPLIVHGAIMIEPTETECKADIDLFIGAMKQVAQEAIDDADLLHSAPVNTKVGRLDETLAARKPCLRG